MTRRLIGWTSRVLSTRCLFWRSSPCALNTSRDGTLTEMTTNTCSAIKPHYAAWSWWDFQVWGSYGLFCRLVFNTCMHFNRQFYSPTGEWIWWRWPGLWRLCVGFHGRWVKQTKSSTGGDATLTSSKPRHVDWTPGCLSPLSDSPGTLESSLSPAELVPFQGCVIPLLAPQQYFSSEDSAVHSSTPGGNPCAHDGAPWEGIAQCQGTVLGDSMEVNNQVNPYCEIYNQCTVWKADTYWLSHSPSVVSRLYVSKMMLGKRPGLFILPNLV